MGQPPVRLLRRCRCPWVMRQTRGGAHQCEGERRRRRLPHRQTQVGVGISRCTVFLCYVLPGCLFPLGLGV